jgi:predicted dehydrogenase
MMDDPVRLAIVGCGGMGRRHLAGLTELSHTPHMNLDLVAVCDPNRQNAEDLATPALQLGLEYHGRPVTIEEVETSVVDLYQHEIDAQLGLLEPAGASV